jgi:hypothetical protein
VPVAALAFTALGDQARELAVMAAVTKMTRRRALARPVEFPLVRDPVRELLGVLRIVLRFLVLVRFARLPAWEPNGPGTKIQVTVAGRMIRTARHSPPDVVN